MWQQQGSFVSRDVETGVRVHVHSGTKFKTTTLQLIGHHPLDSGASRNALLALVLRRGTRRLRDGLAVARRLEDLFGAVLEIDVFKLGDRQNVAFGLEVLADRYARPGLLREGMEFLAQLVFEPRLDGEDRFHAPFFDREKQLLTSRLEARKEDREAFAAERLFEEMFRGECYALHELGTLDEVRAIDNESLVRQWRAWKERMPFDLFVVGDADPDEVWRAARSLFPSGTRRAVAPARLPQRRERAEPRTVFESARVTEGKLAIGLRTAGVRGRIGHLYCDALLGGGPTSRLFRVLREQEGLVYTIATSFDRLKGTLSVHAGIDPRDADRAVDQVRREMDGLQRGDFADGELEAARLSFLRRLHALGDDPSELIHAAHVASVAGTDWSVSRALERHAGIDREQIRAAASELALDTVFLLHEPRWEPLPASVPVGAGSDEGSVPACA